jgi:UDP-2-acetamido-3-amino-2,3-dideoxy-glucuronate N-acetyltransferase
MVGHLLMYHPAVIAMADLVRRGRIGRIRYLGIRRRAFGRLQGGCSVLWDLGPHDISIALMVTGGQPQAVSSLGRAFIQPGLPEIAFTAISLGRGVLAHIEESWMACCASASCWRSATRMPSRRAGRGRGPPQAFRQ